jgi:hypothetical protein
MFTMRFSSWRGSYREAQSRVETDEGKEDNVRLQMEGEIDDVKT